LQKFAYILNSGCKNFFFKLFAKGRFFICFSFEIGLFENVHFNSKKSPPTPILCIKIKEFYWFRKFVLLYVICVFIVNKLHMLYHFNSQKKIIFWFMLFSIWNNGKFWKNFFLLHSSIIFNSRVKILKSYIKPDI
jgi:glycosyltransferase involved in cell wall biosynthesis